MRTPQCKPIRFHRAAREDVTEGPLQRPTSKTRCSGHSDQFTHTTVHIIDACAKDTHSCSCLDSAAIRFIRCYKYVPPGSVRRGEAIRPGVSYSVANTQPLQGSCHRQRRRLV